ncbi:MAG: hypothetical protein M0P71_02325 [Melioribacteraceae bacterium]|nr:hypothetical protein [Melioribacteraceae bacterium]
MDKYQKAIRENVCAICVDSNEHGACTLTNKEACAVQLYLPEIVELVHKYEGKNLDELKLQLRDKICSHCRTNGEEGDCYLREDANCSLDRYFMLIVDIIKRVDNELN